MASEERPFVTPKGVLAAWHKHENAPRTPCPACAFESSEGYPPSHAPGCPEAGASSTCSLCHVALNPDMQREGMCSTCFRLSEEGSGAYQPSEPESPYGDVTHSGGPGAKCADRVTYWENPFDCQAPAGHFQSHFCEISASDGRPITLEWGGTMQPTEEATDD